MKVTAHLLASAAILSLILAVACGGTTRSTPAPPPPTTGSPTPPGAPPSAPTSSPTPSPTPPPSPTPAPPPSPSPAPSTVPDNYSAQLLDLVGRNSALVHVGTVAVDSSSNDGTGVITIKSNFAGSPPQDTLLFCPFATGLQNCITVATFIEAPQGSTVSFTMPKGTWSGIFEVFESGAPFWSSGMSTSASNLGFQSAMLPASSITGGVSTAVGTESGSGTMSTVGSTLRLSISSAKPNNSYTVQLCDINQHCKVLGTAVSNSFGGIADTFDTGTWDMFLGEVALSDSNGFEYISGFRSE